MTIGDLFARYADSGHPGAGADMDVSMGVSVDVGASAPALTQVSLVLQSAMTLIAAAYDRMQPVIDVVSTGFDGMTRLTGVAAPASRMSGWLEAARRYDIPDGDIANAVNAIRIASTQSRADGGSGKAWESLGIAPQSEPLDVLAQIPGRIKGLDQDYARSLLAGIGIGDNVFRLLRQQDIPVDTGLGENAGANDGPAHAFRSLSSLDVANSLLDMAGNTLNEIAGVAGNILNAQRGIRDRVRAHSREENSNTQTLAIGDLNDRSLDGKTVSGGELGALIEAITEPGRQLLTAFGKAYETSEGEPGGIGNVLEDVKEAFGKWDTIDPEKYAASMAEHLKTQALPAAGNVPATAQAAAAPVTNVNVSQYIESGGDPLDMARQITREIETAGRQYPMASY
jgi:hypothetical protein